MMSQRSPILFPIFPLYFCLKVIFSKTCQTGLVDVKAVIILYHCWEVVTREETLCSLEMESCDPELWVVTRTGDFPADELPAVPRMFIGCVPHIGLW